MRKSLAPSQSESACGDRAAQTRHKAHKQTAVSRDISPHRLAAALSAKQRPGFLTAACNSEPRDGRGKQRIGRVFTRLQSSHRCAHANDLRQQQEPDLQDYRCKALESHLARSKRRRSARGKSQAAWIPFHGHCQAGQRMASCSRWSGPQVEGASIIWGAQGVSRSGTFWADPKAEDLAPGTEGAPGSSSNQTCAACT